MKPIRLGRASRQAVVDDTNDQTRVGRCPEHGPETVMYVRGEWRLICCGRTSDFTVPHPVSVLKVPMLEADRTAGRFYWGTPRSRGIWYGHKDR